MQIKVTNCALMSSLKENSNKFLKSRIFIKKREQARSSINDKSNLAIRHPTQIFQHDAQQSTIPKASLYSIDKFSILDNPNEGMQKAAVNWVTVIGYQPGRSQELIDYFSKFATVNKFEEGPGNWCYLLFGSNENTQTFFSQTQNGPIIISADYVISVHSGRIKHAYSQKNELPRKVDFDPIIVDERAKERKHLLSVIIDKLF